jgi:cytochrome oxidase Cu insertion factor (SCO1/SenC/PrrC family)
MSRPEKVIGWSVWVGVGLIAATLTLALVLYKLKSELAARPPQLPVICSVPAFALTNQLGQPVTLETLKGRAWVADIIFTRCAGPCPVMTRQMRELQDGLPSDSRARLITLSTDPEYDTAPVLKAYGDKFGAKAERWSFLTGPPREVASLAIDGLKLTAIAKKPEERTAPADLFVHSTIFVVVDKAGRLRGAFETQGEHVNWPDMRGKILASVKELENEP